MMAGRELIRIITFTFMFFLVHGNFLRKPKGPSGHSDEFEIEEVKEKENIDHPNDLCNRHLEYGWDIFGPKGLLRSREIFCTWVECAVPCWRKRTPGAKKECVEHCDLYRRFLVASVNFKTYGDYFDIIDPSFRRINKNPYPDVINPVTKQPGDGKRLIIDIMKSCNNDCMNFARAEEDVNCTKQRCKEFDYILPFVFPKYAEEEVNMLKELYALWDSCMKVDRRECYNEECIYNNCPDLYSKFAKLVPTKTRTLKYSMHMCKLDCAVKLIDDARERNFGHMGGVNPLDIVNPVKIGECLEANLENMCGELADQMKDH